MIVQICVGSSCHLKGSERVVELFREAIEQRQLENEITLTGCFCTGRCNREGVTVVVDDTVHTGVTPENFAEFFTHKVAAALPAEGV